MMKIEEELQARIEFISYALAHCPECDAEHEVSTCSHGTIECVCGVDLYWQTEE
jgi:hypothetical protein